MANGISLMDGCELDVRHWVKHGYTRRQYLRWIEHRAKHPELYAPVVKATAPVQGNASPSPIDRTNSDIAP